MLRMTQSANMLQRTIREVTMVKTRVMSMVAAFAATACSILSLYAAP
jgi:hypothetical protein